VSPVAIESLPAATEEVSAGWSFAEVEAGVEIPLGQAALVLAARIDANQDSGGAIAAMAKQLASTLSAATAGANVVASPVDELRARRAAKRA
jgi:hypothetical protein